ncbi:MAG: hypothetical protein HY287_18010 [Planctomycetes bacterium]|nr:hypothetical protein [Planctomycetota bacterium]MBI3836219.1 hypothetical protein [Planctomycetota bacterium]
MKRRTTMRRPGIPIPMGIRAFLGRVFLPIWILISGSSVWAQHPGHTMHPLMDNQKMVLRVQLPSTQSPKKIEFPVTIDASNLEQNPNLQVDLPTPYAPLKVVHFLAQAQMKQEVTADETGGGRPATELSIEGPTQSFHRWLVAGDPERDRLSSYIGTWRFMSVDSQADADVLRKQFETEFTRPPEIVVSASGAAAGAPRRFVVQEGATYTLDAMNGKISVRKFYTDYALDREIVRAVNQSARRHNPAVLVEIEQNGVKETRTLFAKFPGFAASRAESLPIDVQLDCPVEPAGDVPDFALLRIKGIGLQVLTRTESGSVARSLDENEFLSISGSPYRFRITRNVPSAKLVESYSRDEHGKPALEIEFAGKGGAPSREWLEFGHTRNFATASGDVIVSFEARDESSPTGGHP